jgi:hypothetical protein
MLAGDYLSKEGRQSWPHRSQAIETGAGSHGSEGQLTDWLNGRMRDRRSTARTSIADQRTRGGIGADRAKRDKAAFA